MYNSGSVDETNLSGPVGTTALYVADVANRMTGWVDAPRLSCWRERLSDVNKKVVRACSARFMVGVGANPMVLY